MIFSQAKMVGVTTMMTTGRIHFPARKVMALDRFVLLRCLLIYFVRLSVPPNHVRSPMMPSHTRPPAHRPVLSLHSFFFGQLGRCLLLISLFYPSPSLHNCNSTCMHTSIVFRPSIFHLRFLGLLSHSNVLQLFTPHTNHA